MIKPLINLPLSRKYYEKNNCNVRQSMPIFNFYKRNNTINIANF